MKNAIELDKICTVKKSRSFKESLYLGLVATRPPNHKLRFYQGLSGQNSSAFIDPCKV